MQHSPLAQHTHHHWPPQLAVHTPQRSQAQVQLQSCMHLRGLKGACLQGPPLIKTQAAQAVMAVMVVVVAARLSA